MDSDTRIKLLIDSDLNHVALAGMSINTICKHFRFNDLDSYRIELSSVEAITNAIKHAYHNKPGNLVEIGITHKKSLHRLEIEVCDWGASVGKEFRPSLDFDPEDYETLPQGGMGLFLIYNIMDEVNIVRDGNKNIWRLVKNLPEKI